MKWNGKEKKGSKNIGTSLKGKEVFPWCSSFAAAKLIHWELELRFFSRVLVSSSFSHTRQWHAVLEVNNRLYRTSLLFCPPSQPKQPFTHSLTHRVPFLLYFLLYHQQVAAWSPREKREREREVALFLLHWCEVYCWRRAFVRWFVTQHTTTKMNCTVH